MSTNYTGDGTAAAIAPDLGQTPEAAPIIQLPADGDLADVASIAQAFKALANHVAWAVKPYASLSTAIRHLKRWRTSLGHTRFALDRNGLPAGTYLQLQESWGFGAGVSGPSSAQLGAYPNWYVNTSAVASGLIFVYQPAAVVTGVPSSRHGIVSISAGNLAGEYYGITGKPLCTFHADADIALEFIANVEDSADPTRPDIIAGLLGSVFHTDPRGLPGAYFWRDASTPNWQAVTRDATSETVIDTGVAVGAGTNFRMRIEYRGANVNDGAAKKVYFYINQVLKATGTTNVPTTGWAAPTFLGKNVAGATIVRPTGPGDIYIGPINHACNVMPSVTT
jgi:hypothetical protein